MAELDELGGMGFGCDLWLCRLRAELDELGGIGFGFDLWLRRRQLGMIFVCTPWYFIFLFQYAHICRLFFCGGRTASPCGAASIFEGGEAGNNAEAGLNRLLVNSAEAGEIDW